MLAATSHRPPMLPTPPMSPTPSNAPSNRSFHTAPSSLIDETAVGSSPQRLVATAELSPFASAPQRSIEEHTDISEASEDSASDASSNVAPRQNRLPRQRRQCFYNPCNISLVATTALMGVMGMLTTTGSLIIGATINKNSPQTCRIPLQWPVIGGLGGTGGGLLLNTAAHTLADFSGRPSAPRLATSALLGVTSGISGALAAAHVHACEFVPNVNVFSSADLLYSPSPTSVTNSTRVRG